MNVKTTHTPGPWHIGTRPGPIIYGPQGEEVRDMRGSLLAPAEHFANIRLIASAPELLAALQDLMPGVEAYADSVKNDEYRSMWVNQIAKARAAVLKATGGQS